MEQQTSYSSSVLQEKIDQLKERMENKRKEMDDLEKENSIITTYKEYQNELEDLTKDCRELEETKRIIFQEECTHPLVYVTECLDDEINAGFKYKCVCCGIEDKIITTYVDFLDNLETFEKEHIIICSEFVGSPIDTPFETIQNEFYELENQGLSTEEISKRVRAVLASKSLLGKRLMNAFPNVQAIIKNYNEKRKQRCQ